MTENIYIRTYGIPNNMDPTGKRYGIIPVPGGQALYRICGLDKDGNPVALHSVPSPDFESSYTHRARAQAIITSYITSLWDESDASSAANAKRANRKESVAA